MNVDNSIISASAINVSLDISGMDLETALLAVQTQRVQLLDQQLQAQLVEVQKRNEQISKLHDLQSALNEAKSHFKNDADGEDKLRNVKINGKKYEYKKDGKVHYNDSHIKIIRDINNALKTAGYDDSVSIDNLTFGSITKRIQDVKNAIDAQGNSQQMDMLRLQGMSGKRNEAFDVMTNFIKKMQDSRSAIIANMR